MYTKCIKTCVNISKQLFHSTLTTILRRKNKHVLLFTDKEILLNVQCMDNRDMQKHGCIIKILCWTKKANLRIRYFISYYVTYKESNCSPGLGSKPGSEVIFIYLSEVLLTHIVS